VPVPEDASTSTNEIPYPHGLIVLSLTDGYYRHLFAYHPSDMQFTRLTNHPWDDINPAISPDGSRLAYASRRNGYWDIYIFDLATGQSTRVTDTPAYDGNPTWAPDGQWLAYETYQTGNLDIFIQSLADLSLPALQLTTDPSADSDPEWSPTGNLLAFTSLRSGEPEIWTAALDQPVNRFQNRSRNPGSADSVQPENIAGPEYCAVFDPHSRSRSVDLVVDEVGGDDRRPLVHADEGDPWRAGLRELSQNPASPPSAHQAVVVGDHGQAGNQAPSESASLPRSHVRGDCREGGCPGRTAG
jgi:beta propeller repeat protein